MDTDKSIPTNYAEWHECITVHCGIPLTPDYITERLIDLSQVEAEETIRFPDCMVTSTGRTSCSGFVRRKVIQAPHQLKPWMIEQAALLPVGASLPWERVFDSLPFGSDGLLPAVAQQYDTGEVLMLAWMNRAALRETLATGHVCYWSRSRARLWRKGETSGHVQHLRELRLDCDGDALLLLVEQTGPACHTGRATCFYNAVRGDRVEVISSALRRSGDDR